MIYTLSDHNWRLITVDADVEYWAYMVHREALRLEESLAQELTRHAIPQSVTSVLTFVLDITLYHEGKKYAEKALEDIIRIKQVGHTLLNVVINIETVVEEDTDSGFGDDEGFIEEGSGEKYNPGKEWIGMMRDAIEWDAEKAE
ncbi:hypothetical protein AAVH_29603 [Aphelenchoides avenae]|nr:hypothetical protein AAVH_29603 [Aphelenchus avenae]